MLGNQAVARLMQAMQIQQAHSVLQADCQARQKNRVNTQACTKCALLHLLTVLRFVVEVPLEGAGAGAFFTGWGLAGGACERARVQDER